MHDGAFLSFPYHWKKAVLKDSRGKGAIFTSF